MPKNSFCIDDKVRIKAPVVSLYGRVQAAFEAANMEGTVVRIDHHLLFPIVVVTPDGSQQEFFRVEELERIEVKTE